MKKLILTLAAVATVGISAFGATSADARGFGRGFGHGFNTTAIVLNDAYWAKVRAERNATQRARRSSAAIRAAAIAKAKAEARARAIAAEKAKAAAVAQARLTAQKAELARLRAENERLQKTASVPTARPIQTAQNQPAPLVNSQAATGECKRFIPTAGITVSVPCS